MEWKHYGGNDVPVELGTVTVQAQHWTKSKQMWLNILTVLAALLSYFAALPELEHVARWAVIALGGVNIILTFLRKEPINGTHDTVRLQRAEPYIGGEPEV